MQIRSQVVNFKNLAQEIKSLASGVEETIIISNASGYLLSGQELETGSRIKDFSSEIESSVTGLAKHISSSRVIVAITSGIGYEEIRELSRQVAQRILPGVALKTPLSIKTLDAAPKADINVRRTL